MASLWALRFLVRTAAAALMVPLALLLVLERLPEGTAAV
jgi:hypothetical protein